jgi:heme peroxidase
MTQQKVSDAQRGTAPWVKSTLMNSASGQSVAGGGYRPSLFVRVYDALAEKVDHRFGWDRLPVPLGLAVLGGLRNKLRRENLYDTTALPTVNPPVPEGGGPARMTARSSDGSYNDLDHPLMGMAGARFGRNFPLDRTFPEPEPELLSPSPRVVSRRLMTRREFQPAPTLNSLAAAWLQFMIRDWFSHDRRERDTPWQLPLEADDDWPTPPLTIPRVPHDPTRPEGSAGPPTNINVNSAWWDASSVYGSNREQQQLVRTGVDGKVHVFGTALPQIPDNRDATREPGFWLGLAMLVTLFMREHNAICDRLRAEYADWGDEDLFQVARLINAALMAKIHTVEWTPALINHPTTARAILYYWWGIASERVHRLFGRISSSELISGIPGSPTNHFGVPFSITEEFAAVYRMHPLIRDDWTFRAVADDALIAEYTFRQIAGPAAMSVTAKVPMHDLFYSFGTLHPGALVLNNFPRYLQEFERPDGKLMDLAATDILRTRELGVPRYNEFRRLLRMNPAKDFEALTDDPALASTLREIYGGNIERVDLIVGLFAEKRPQGFAFSDTTFRIFLAATSRRLNSDRFFTHDYTPEIYTQTGLNWIENNTMSSVLLRHYPQLRSALRDVDNAFKPWRRTSA